MQDIKTCDVYNCKLTLFEQRYDSTKYKCLMQTVTDQCIVCYLARTKGYIKFCGFYSAKSHDLPFL